MVQLRRPGAEDITILATLANNRKVWENLRDHFPFPYLESDAREFISMCEEEDPPHTFAITCNGEFCGIAGFSRGINPDEAELGYWLGEPYWNRGITSEAVRQMVAYGKNELGLKCITAAVFEFNPVSSRILEHAGFIKTKQENNHFSIKNGQKVREIHYILKIN